MVALLSIEPKIGDVRKGSEIGQGQRYLKYIYLSCQNCGKERWVRLYYYNRGESTLCFSCASKEKLLHLPPPRPKEREILTYASHTSCAHDFYVDFDYDTGKWCKVCWYCGYEEDINH